MRSSMIIMGIVLLLIGCIGRNPAISPVEGPLPTLTVLIVGQIYGGQPSISPSPSTTNLITAQSINFTALPTSPVPTVEIFESVEPSQEVDSQYPVPGERSTSVSPISTPEPERSYPPPVPYSFQPTVEGAISVHGRLILKDPFFSTPADDGLYLVELQMGQDGSQDHPPIQVGLSFQADLDEITGEFLFTNLKPGRYLAMIMTRRGSQVSTRYYDTNQRVIILLTSKDLNQIVEIGVIYF